MADAAETTKKDNTIKYGAGAVASLAGLKALGGAGLLKVGFTMLLSLWFYAQAYGWGYGAVIIVLILIHEMGHWIFMKFKGLNPEAPVFVPFVGAYVAMTKMAEDQATDAWVAFWGPFIGGAGSLLIFIIGFATGNGTLMAGGNFGFFLNLLQLVPARPLDGGFIAEAISKWLLIPGTILLLALGFYMQSPLFVIIGLVSIVSLIRKRKTAPDASNETLNALTTSTDIGAQQPTKEKRPATSKQRIAIGLAYVGLALVLGVMQIIASAMLESNKDYTAVQLEQINEQLKHSSDIDLYRQRAQCYDVLGEAEKGEADLERFLQSGTPTAQDYIALARFRLTQGHADTTTRNALRQALSFQDLDQDDAQRIAFDSVLINDNEQALKAVKRFNDKDASYIKAIVFERMGNLKEASACFDEMLKDPNQAIYAYSSRALMEISNNEISKAGSDVKELTSLDTSDDPLAYLTFGWYKLYTNDYNGAVSDADSVIRSYSEPAIDPDKWYIITACHRLKAAAYQKLSIAATDPAEKQKYDQLVSSEMAAFNAMPGFDIYIPTNINSLFK